MPVPPLAGAAPVRFDDSAALALISALDRLIDELRASGVVVGDAAEAARRDWRGPSRRWFDDRDASIATQRRGAAALADAEIDDVRRAMAWAAAEQQRRNAEALRAEAVEIARLAQLAAPSRTTRPT